MSLKSLKTTDIVSYIIIVGFIFYLYNAKPFSNLNPYNNHYKEDSIIANANKQNAFLNQNALLDKGHFEAEIYVGDVYLKIDEMPRYKSCEYKNESEAIYCTRLNLNYYFSKFEVEPYLLNKLYSLESIHVGFIVETNGSISGVSVINGDNNEIDSLIIDYVMKLPKFKAGIHKGKNVRVKYVVPFTF